MRSFPLEYVCESRHSRPSRVMSSHVLDEQPKYDINLLKPVNVVVVWRTIRIGTPFNEKRQMGLAWCEIGVACLITSCCDEKRLHLIDGF